MFKEVLNTILGLFYSGTPKTDFRPFDEWTERIHSEENLDSIKSHGGKLGDVNIKCNVMFGDKLGMMLIESDVRDKEGMQIPGVVLLRGRTVAILIIVEVDGVDNVVLVKQARVATGQYIEEIPAGMVDDDNTLVDTALTETIEETGLKLEKDKLLHLGSAFPSPGACDEEITFYYVGCTVQPDCSIKHGNKKENEKISVVLRPLNDTSHVKDGKFWTALGLWNAFKGQSVYGTDDI